MPFFICLYGVIKGLVYTTTVHHVKIPSPRYLDKSTEMYKDIIAAGGKLKSFGIDLSQTPFQHHGSIGQGLPYWIIFFAAIGLQYVQMSRLNKRNAANIQNNPQMQTMQTMQKVTPLIFGVIYIAFPIGVTVYFIVSSLCRIIIQEILFRTGVTAPKPAIAGDAPAARGVKAPRKRTIMDRLADAQATAAETRRRQLEIQDTIDAHTSDESAPPAGSAKPPGPQRRPGSPQPRPSQSNGSANGAPRGNGNSPQGPKQNGARTNRSTSGGSSELGAGEKPKQAPPRSKDKKPRKAR
ncbi:MAG: YidC/Oxa1 family membrane protein insertase [Acidimicrobiales bacterium]